MPLVEGFHSSTVSLHSAGDHYIDITSTDLRSPQRKRSRQSFVAVTRPQARHLYSVSSPRRMRGSHRHRRSSLDWQLQGGIGMSRHMPVNFSNRVSGHGLAESDGGIQTYHTPLSQTFTAVDFDMQNASASHTAQAYTPFAVLTGPQCIPVCCAATMTTPAHVPVTAWTYPAPCGAPGVQLIPCCDASTCTSRHVSAPRQFYSRPNAVGIGPYHCPPYRHHHHHSRHRLPTPSLSSVPVPLPGSVYQPHHLPSSSVVAPPSVFSSQQQGPTSQTVYRRQQVSHNVYRSSALLNRSQQSDDSVMESSMPSVAFPPVTSQVYQHQAPHPAPIRHHTTMSAQPVLLQQLPSTEFINGGTLSTQQYRPVTSARQHGWPTYQTLATPYSGYLLHFLTMLGRPPTAAVMSTSLTHHHQSTLQQHEDLAASAADLDSYEALLSLAERLGEVKSRGLTRSDIDRLHCYRYSSIDDSNDSQSEVDAGAGSASVLDQTSCVVCLCDFEPQELVRALPCKHEFHASCVDRWLKMNRTCPLCRADVTELTKIDVD